MSIGSAVRALFGPFEPAVASAYRRVFFDVGEFAQLVRDWAPEARSILEVGCGEGQVTQALVGRFPGAHATGIDLTPRVGRLYRGDPGAATFRRAPVEAMTSGFHLVVVCDVLHHVPMSERTSFMRSVAHAVAPGGKLVLKEWVRAASPVHMAVYLSDRLLTQDRIQYCTADEVRSHVEAAFGPVTREARVSPWSNNLVLCASTLGPAGRR